MTDAAVVHEMEMEALEVRAHHPSDWLYIKVFIFLAIVTSLEVSVTYIHALKSVEIPLLIVMMIIKFFTVTMYFMHLKFDPKMCSRVFNFGLGIALGVYIIMLSTFEFWAPHFL